MSAVVDRAAYLLLAFAITNFLKLVVVKFKARSTSRQGEHAMVSFEFLIVTVAQKIIRTSSMRNSMNFIELIFPKMMSQIDIILGKMMSFCDAILMMMIIS